MSKHINKWLNRPTEGLSSEKTTIQNMYLRTQITVYATTQIVTTPKESARQSQLNQLSTYHDSRIEIIHTYLER